MVVAHPDDVEYSGLSAVASRLTSVGRPVSYFVLTRGEAGMAGTSPAEAAALRQAEQLQAAAAVGVEVVEFADYPDGAIEAGPALRCRIADALRRHRPEAVFTLNPHLRSGGGGVNQADHRAAGLAVLDAVQAAANPWLCLAPGDPGPSPLAWAGVSVVGCAAVPYPTHGIDVTGHVGRAVAALLAHSSYIAAVGDPRQTEEALRWGLAGAGARLGVAAAVAMEVFTF